MPHLEVIGYTATMSIRTYFSGRYLQAASHLAVRAQVLEATGTGPLNLGEFNEHQGAVVSAVMLAVASLEALVNEILTDANEGKPTAIQGLNDPQVQKVRTLARLPQTGRLSILEKYEALHLVLVDRDLPKGEEPYQSAALLIRLRNALVHFLPESVTTDGNTETNEIHHLERSLKGRFEGNKRMSDGNPWYPDKALGAGCAEWSVSRARAFAINFCGVIGVKVPFGF